MFAPKIIKLADNVYSAVGYQVSTNTMIIGDDGVIIIDPGLIPPVAQKVREEFKKITNKPVKAIIYTHGHVDHTNATSAFYTDNTDIQIWARSNYDSESRRHEEASLRDFQRPAETQGIDLLPEQRIGVGVAIPPSRAPQPGGARPNTESRTIAPTHLFEEPRMKLEISSVKLELVAAPGETDDQLYVWLPEQRIVFAGDNFYQSWPNVYPLRGIERRSIRDWINSINMMIQEQPLHLVGGHTTPMMDNAVEVLTNYRDAMQWVLDRTIEGAKKSLTPDELVEYAALPKHLAKLDYLADYYGTIESTVRDIYAQDLGWFDGNPLNLHRENPIKQAQRVAALVGGPETLMQKARDAFKAGDNLGSAQLAHHMMQLQPENPEPVLLMADALAIIGEETFNANVRNYTLSYSNRLRKKSEKLKIE